jgi:hypothetical protein
MWCGVAAAAELMSTELAALVGESYERAYTDMVSRHYSGTVVGKQAPCSGKMNSARNGRAVRSAFLHVCSLGGSMQDNLVCVRCSF